MRRLWNWLLVESHLKAATFLFGALAALASGVFGLMVYLDERPAEPSVVSGPTATTPVTSQPVEAPPDPDQKLRELLVGRWSGGRRHYPPNLTLDVEYSISPNGTFNWTGRNAIMILNISGTWSIDDGVYSARVTSSTGPGIVPVDTRYNSPILALDRQIYSYIDNITGQRVTDRRL